MKEKIIDGSKRQTVWRLRKRPIKVGDKLILFWKQRTKECEHLKEASCIQEFKIQLVLSDSGSKITAWMLVDEEDRGSGRWVQINNETLDEIARYDGFDDVASPVQAFINTLLKMHGSLAGIWQVVRW
jgi:hypothetical protein